MWDDYVHEVMAVKDTLVRAQLCMTGHVEIAEVFRSLGVARILVVVHSFEVVHRGPIRREEPGGILVVAVDENRMELENNSEA
jgi:hypothetical protein